MAITIVSDLTSGYFYPSANPITITVDSNNSGKCNFRYICDIYLNGTKCQTLKLFPDPVSGYGFFDVSRVVQDYTTTFDLKTNPSNLLTAAASAQLPSAAATLQLRFGEEYDTSTTCDGVIYQFLNLKYSNTAYVFESALDLLPNFHFNSTSYIVGTSGTASFLSEAPRTIDLTYNDGYYVDFLTKQTINVLNWRVDIKTFNSSGVQMATHSYSTNSTHTGVYRFRIACGPSDINSVSNATIINPQVSHYTVQLRWVPGSNYTTEILTIRVKEPTTFRHRFQFIGQSGTPESFTFFHRLRKSVNIERQTYAKPLLSNYASKLAYQLGDRGTDIFAMKAFETGNVSTFVAKDWSELVSQMWYSKDVWFVERPELIPYTTHYTGGQLKLVIKDFENAVGYNLATPANKLVAGDSIFIFGDDQNLNGKYTISNFDGKVLTGTWSSATQVSCGWLHKVTNWYKMPIVLNQNSVEIKERLGRPIQYDLTFDFANPKILLR